VIDHPGAYLAHRWNVAERTFGLHRGRAWRPLYKRFLGTRAQRAAIQHTARHSLVQRALTWCVASLSHTMLFHPYIYALLALLLLPLAIASRCRDAIALLTSGLLGAVGELVYAQAPELRYSLWLIVTTLLATIVLVAHRQKRGTNASATTHS
jgi:hypothetical protein